MPSKTSFCNGTEFRKCLSRWWPLWIIYGVILFILLPGVLLNARTTTPYVTTPYVSTEQIGYLSNVILSETQMLLPLTAFCAGLLAAAAMFAARRGAGRLPADPARVHVPHASAGGPFDAAFSRGRGLRSRRAH